MKSVWLDCCQFLGVCVSGSYGIAWERKRNEIQVFVCFKIQPNINNFFGIFVLNLVVASLQLSSKFSWQVYFHSPCPWCFLGPMGSFFILTIWPWPSQSLFKHSHKQKKGVPFRCYRSLNLLVYYIQFLTFGTWRTCNVWNHNKVKLCN